MLSFGVYTILITSISFPADFWTKKGCFGKIKYKKGRQHHYDSLIGMQKAPTAISN